MAGHPLFAGIDRWRVTGLPEPVLEETGDTIRIAGEGVTVTAVGVKVEREGQQIRLIASAAAGDTLPGR